jgi:hypothetical protein
VPATTCGSWVATDTTTTTTTTTPPNTTPPGPTETPLAINAKRCYAESDFPNHGDISPDWVESYTWWACGQDDTAPVDVVLGPDSAPLRFNTVTNGVPYWFSVGWIEGCATSVDQQSAWNPVPGTEDTCQSLLWGNYANCKSFSRCLLAFQVVKKSPWGYLPTRVLILDTGDNGGVGGYAEAGCLRYVFEPCDPDTRTCRF